MIIYIVRHAWAGEAGDPRYPNDNERPLTDDGKERFAKFAKKLVKRGLEAKRIASSPLVRCRQTSEILANAIGSKPKIDELRSLAPGSDVTQLIAWSAQQEGNVVWCGHAPDVGYLTAALLGIDHLPIGFTKGACAAVELYRPRAGAGELLWFATAGLLGC